MDGRVRMGATTARQGEGTMDAGAGTGVKCCGGPREEEKVSSEKKREKRGGHTQNGTHRHSGGAEAWDQDQ